MRDVTVYTAPWYPGHTKLQAAVERAQEKAEGRAAFHVVDVSENVPAAEEARVVSIPTAILSKDGKERRRVFGAVGMVELLGIAGIKSRARKI